MLDAGYLMLDVEDPALDGLYTLFNFIDECAYFFCVSFWTL